MIDNDETKLRSKSVASIVEQFIEQLDMSEKIFVNYSSSWYKLNSSLKTHKNEIVNISALQVILILKRIMDTKKIPYNENEFESKFELIRKRISEKNQSKIFLDMSVLKSQKIDASDDEKIGLLKIEGVNTKTHLKDNDAYALKYSDFRFKNIKKIHFDFLCIGVWFTKDSEPIEILINKIGNRHK